MKVVYFQNPEMCNEQAYWLRNEGEPEPTADDGADGWIGGDGWPVEFMVKGEQQRADYWANQFARECLGLEAPFRWEYVNISN